MPDFLHSQAIGQVLEESRKAALQVHETAAAANELIANVNRDIVTPIAEIITAIKAALSKGQP